MRKELFVALGMTILLNQVSFAADVTYYGMSAGDARVNALQFQDVSGKGSSYWAASAIYEMTALSVMNGFSSSVFSPDSYVTNEQAITIVLNALGKADEVQKMKGIANTWSDKYIKYAMNQGLITEKIVMKKSDISGNAEAMKAKGVLIRDYPITREEMAGLICRAFSLNTKEEAKIDFYDKTQIDEKYKNYVEAVSSNQIMVGTEDKMFQPKSGLKRAELAQIFKNCETLLLDDLSLVKKQGFIDSVSDTSVSMTDDEGNEIAIDLAGKNIPVFRNGKLSGKEALRASDEIEYFIGTDKSVLFIRVIDEGIDETGDSGVIETVSKQGIVVGNSPYFYQISVKNRLGETESYTYGEWTSIWKDGKETKASEILQGDTVYLEFDELGDLVVIRGVTNTVITYGTITNLTSGVITVENDQYESKKYSVSRVPIYKNGEEIALSEVHTGEYAKIYSSASELIKIEIVPDSRTVYHIYKGYISDINRVQERIILRDTACLEDSKWKSLSESFISIPLDSEMEIHYDGKAISMAELGEKQVGKYAYIVTREDTKTLEKVKSMIIGSFSKEVTRSGEYRSYSASSGQLRLYNDSERYGMTEDTLFIIDGKVVKLPKFDGGDEVTVTAVYEEGEYIAKVVVATKKEEKIEEKPLLYSGTIKSIEEEEEVTLRLNGKFDGEEWYSVRNKVANFVLTKTSRIFTESGPINIRELTDEGATNYKDSNAIIVAVGDEIVTLSTIDAGEMPYLLRGVINSVNGTEFVISETEYYDFEEEDWLGIRKTTVLLGESPVVVKNGEYARQKDIEKGQEVLVLKKDKTSNAAIILLTD
ncbi:MAG: S-layer homology domain-containing protein [Clostridia bacterium]|nr:S-layer homology domain-containing protein [Clostridia bacterium]